MSDLCVGRPGWVRVVQKAWGDERWVVNAPGYCGKIMTVFPRKRCSRHYHREKDETFYVLDGTLVVELTGFETVNLKVGESVRIPPGTEHRFWTLERQPVRFIEFSTHHEDADTVRTEPSGDIP